MLCRGDLIYSHLAIPRGPLLAFLVAVRVKDAFRYEVTVKQIGISKRRDSTRHTEFTPCVKRDTVLPCVKRDTVLPCVKRIERWGKEGLILLLFMPCH